jgi:hypothetical protein
VSRRVNNVEDAVAHRLREAAGLEEVTAKLREPG